MKWNTKDSLGWLAGAVCAAAAVLLAGLLALQPTEVTKVRTGTALNVTDSYRATMDEALTRIVFGEVAIPKKQYIIPDNALAAPTPDQSKFGACEDPAQLGWLLEEAAEILDGQSLYFSTETELLPDSTVQYYLDDTIFAITWKEVIDRVVFTFSEVKLAHPSQFRRYLSGGEYGSGKLSLTTEMSASVNAVVACSADYYAYRRKGLTVVDGVVYKANAGVADACFIDRSGDLILERDLTFENAEALQAYVDENNINFSLSFGPILIKDGENICPQRYSLGEVTEPFPRAAICQMDTLHYLFAASNMEARHYARLQMPEFAQSLERTGCRQAYALDGGQTATVVMNNRLINNVNYGSERMISDIIYFATAKPAGE